MIGDASRVSTITNAVHWGYHAALDIQTNNIQMVQNVSRDTVLVVRREVESHHLLAGRFVRHIVQYYENAKGNTASF